MQGKRYAATQAQLAFKEGNTQWVLQLGAADADSEPWQAVGGANGGLEGAAGEKVAGDERCYLEVVRQVRVLLEGKRWAVHSRKRCSVMQRAVHSAVRAATQIRPCQAGGSCTIC